MKLATYTPQVQRNTINAQVEAPAAQALANIGQMQAQGLGGLARGLNVGLGVVQKRNEELDAVNAQAAANEYTKRLNEVMYNQDTGLMNKKLQGADGITTQFEEAEQKIRQEVGDQYQFNTRKGQLVLQNMMNNSAAQRFNLIQKHQFQQKEAYDNAVYANALDLNMQTAGNNFTDDVVVEDSVRQAMASAAMHFHGQGEEVVAMKSRQAAGDVVQHTINFALKSGDLATASKLLDRYAGFVDPSKLPGIVGNIRAQRTDNFMADKAQELARSGLTGSALEAAIDGLQVPGYSGTFENLKKTTDPTLGQPYKLGASGTDGSWDCGLWTQTMLNRNGENIQVRTADGQYAQMEREGRAFKDASKLKPGDLVFMHTTDRWKYTDNPNAGADEAYKGITHVGIYMGNGKVRQAGGSGVSDADLSDFDVVGYGRTTIGSAPQGRNLDSTQKMQLARMVDTLRAKQKRIEAEAKDALLTKADELFRAAGAQADPDAIAKQVAGDNVPMRNFIKDYYTKVKYKIKEKGADDTAIFTLQDMIKSGRFDSEYDLSVFMQNSPDPYSTKQIRKMQQEYQQYLKGEGIYGYDDLDKYIKPFVKDIKDETEKLIKSATYRQFAADAINEFRRDPKNKGKDPTPDQLAQLLSKKITGTKMIAQASDGTRYKYDQLQLTNRGIISAEQVSPGMMNVRYRTSGYYDGGKYRGREAQIPVERFAAEAGLEEDNSWFG